MLILRRISFCLICAVALLVTVGSAQAAFPGKNGKIAFASDMDWEYAPDFQGREIFTMNPDGSHLVRLTSNSGFSYGDSDPAWSPDGKWIAFVRRDHSGAGSGSFLHVMRSNGTGMRRIPNTGYNARGVTWSPDGKTLAFANVPGTQCGSASTECTDNRGGFDIWTVQLDGTGLTQITAAGRDDVDPAWSPDGTKIAFISARYADGNPVLSTMSPDGTGVFRVGTAASTEGYPDWSPDGSRIVFHTDRVPHYGGSKIWTIGPDRSDPVQITKAQGSVDRTPTWSPDGTRLAFTSPMSVYGYRIHTSNADGTGVVRLTDNVSQGVFDFDPDWQALQRPRREDYRTAAFFCLDEREYLGGPAFKDKYGRPFAFARCVVANA